MATQEDVRRIALSFPEAVEDPVSFRFLMRDKLFAWAYREKAAGQRRRVERADVLVVRVADEWDKEALLAMDPETFFTTPHYNGYPAVLVRLPLIDVDELAELLTRAWRCRAPRSLASQHNRDRAVQNEQSPS